MSKRFEYVLKKATEAAAFGGGPVYPMIYECDENSSTVTAQVFGISKREQFAALAMQSFIGATDYKVKNPGELARDSIQCADALIWELHKKQKDNQ